MNRRELSTLLRSMAAFEAVARSGGFGAAARELGIAQSALSRHVARLEAFAGQPLFRRSGRGAASTEAGTTLARQVSEALDQLADALEATRPQAASKSLTIASSHDVGGLWLIPRVNRFRAQHPDVDVRLVVGDTYAGFDRDGIDVSLRFGNGSWNGRRSVRLFDEEVIAVAAPSLIAKSAALRNPRSPRDLLSVPLVHVAPSRGLDWMSWLRALGIRTTRDASMHYPTYQTSLESAVDGEGVALYWRFLSGKYLARGQLQQVGPWKVRSGEALYAVCAPSASALTDRLIDVFFAEDAGR